MLRYFPWRYVRHYIDLTKSFEQYLNGMSYASRKSFKRRIRKFTEFSGGEIIWREYRGSHIEEFYSHAREISKKTYQELLLGEGLPATEEFRNNILELSLKDNVIGYLLYHKNHPIAYSYFHAEDEILFNAFGGYDPEYRQWSPGTILDLLIIEKLFTEKKFRVLDMGPGDFDYKRTLSTDHFLCTDILFLRKTLSNKFLMNTYFIWGSITKFGISVAEKLRVKTMLKRLNKQVVFPSNSIAIIITDYIEMFPFSIIASQI